MIIHLSKMIDPVMYTVRTETRNWHLPSLAGAFHFSFTSRREKHPSSVQWGAISKRSAKYDRQNRIAMGHVQTVQYIAAITV